MRNKHEAEYHKYINHFIRGHCAADMLGRDMFPNGKEITESMAAFRAVMKYAGVSYDDDVTIVAVGDGHTPRTGALFAFRTKWICHSIDPNLRDQVWDVKRLTCHRARLEDVRIESEVPVVVVAVHSHAPLHCCFESIKAPKMAIVEIPCCVGQVMHARPHLNYRDPAIWSPKNEVKIWSFEALAKTEEHWWYKKQAGIAQTEEHEIRNLEVAGSTPAAS